MAEEEKVIPMEEVDAMKGAPRERTILTAPKRAFGGFLDFIRERGVMGLAIGFVLGSSVQRVVTAFVNDIVNPFIGVLFGNAEGIKAFMLGPFLVGNFLAVLIDFLILAFIVYLVFKGLGLDRLDKLKA